MTLADKGNPALEGVKGDQQRALQRVPPFGEIVEAEWDSSGATQTVFHGMGRVFTGAIVIKQSNGAVTYQIADEESSRALDVDIENAISVAPSGSHSGTVWIWVF